MLWVEIKFLPSICHIYAHLTRKKIEKDHGFLLFFLILTIKKHIFCWQAEALCAIMAAHENRQL